MAIALNDNIKISSPKPIDDRYFDTATWQTPWSDVSSALAGIPSTVRFQGLTINVGWTEYRFKDWIADWDLIEKETWGSSVEKLVYTRSTIYRINDAIIDDDYYSIQTAWKGNKNVVGGNSKSFDVSYFKCYFDIFEYDSSNNKVSQNIWLKFSWTTDLHNWILSNCSVTAGNADNHIIVEVYDIINEEVPQVTSLNVVNTFYHILRWRWNGKNSSSDFTRLPQESALSWDWFKYRMFIENLFNTLFPQLWWYTYNAVDEPRRAIWMPRNWRNRYQLLNDEAQIDFTNGQRHSIDWAWNFINWINTPKRAQWVTWEVVWSESYYVLVNRNTQEFWWIFQKNDYKTLVNQIRKDEYSVVIAYKLHANYLWTDYYSAYIKPVWADELYINSYDDTLYDLYGYTNEKDWYGEMMKIFPDNRPVAEMKARISKSNINWLLKKSLWDYGWGHPRKNCKLFLRDKTTDMISPLTDKYIYLEKWRDKPPVLTLSR